MTIREKVLRQKRVADFLWIGGTAGAMLCFFSAASSLALRWLVFPGILSFLAAMAGSIYRIYAIRCPRCSYRLGGAIMSPVNPLGPAEPVVMCPYCGTRFDEECEATPNNSLQSPTRWCLDIPLQRYETRVSY
ncbi:MAG: hypothetical protein DME98_05450 [Verrucomicrobia bacterium]|nr:MAG: hypothetical protein DME98_05450 [Verrucomicrobiota bacterium]PYJ33152.1 MAG: hypothetical protein DME88_09045 [Verrucomicrobiota bacterium]PYL48113.1 MAG: hypothetical protein DMF32_09700 [Verrucomicrobiota bacterium]